MRGDRVVLRHGHNKGADTLMSVFRWGAGPWLGQGRAKKGGEPIEDVIHELTAAALNWALRQGQCSRPELN